ncbi:YccF domain-containing protein [Candidatus Poribacteria bacterium]|nr:YccF domain-containing protein [Candidatus Poribacteria bacterium]
MSLLGNILWILIGGGVFIFLEYIISGFLLCCTIIGIPFGIQCIKLSVLGLIPFGKKVVNTESSTSCLAVIMNILWILLGGIWIGITHLIFAILCAITIIGIPFAKQHFKLASLAFTPFGKEIIG